MSDTLLNSELAASVAACAACCAGPLLAELAKDGVGAVENPNTG